MIENRDDVWLFAVQPALNQTSFFIPASNGAFAAGLLPGDSQFVHHLARNGGYAAATGHEARPGYLLDRIFWRRPPGAYRIDVVGEGSGEVALEARDATTGTLIENVPVRFGHRSTHSLSFEFRPVGESEFVYSGFPPFQAQPVSSPKNDRIELRIFVPPHAAVRVFHVALHSV